MQYHCLLVFIIDNSATTLRKLIVLMNTSSRVGQCANRVQYFKPIQLHTK